MCLFKNRLELLQEQGPHACEAAGCSQRWFRRQTVVVFGAMLLQPLPFLL